MNTGLPAQQAHTTGAFSRLAADVYFFCDSVNVGVVKQDDNVAIIDCGDGLVLSCLEKINAFSVSTALFTHHHADQASGCWKLNTIGTKIGVPIGELGCFTNVDTFFADPLSQYNRYDMRPNLNMIRKSVNVDFTVSEGDEYLFGNIKITALKTPGHTDDSTTYLVKTADALIAFVGDLLYDCGKIQNLYSLQKNDGYFTDYHGFMGAYTTLVQSLDKLAACNPTVIVPSHGNVIHNPQQAITQLKSNLKECFHLYKEISSSLHWFGEYDRFPALSTIKESLLPVPAWVREIKDQPVRLLIAPDRSAFVLDCGTEEALEEIDRMMREKEITSIDGIWVSHYHDDHVTYISCLQKKYNCPVYCHVCFCDVLENPSAYNLPCLCPTPIKVKYPVKNFEDIVWKGFKMTNCYFPGQSIYHAALFVQKVVPQLGDQTVFFIGDSFTPSGIDDYCAFNINPLKPNDGYLYCLELLETFRADLLINQHQSGAFRFSGESINHMRANLMQRFESFAKLLPQGNVNYGLYPDWVQVYPYCQSLKRDMAYNVKFSVDNYSDHADFYKLEMRLPVGLRGCSTDTMEFEMRIEPNDTRHVSFSLKVPKDTPKGTYLIGLAIWKNNEFLGEQSHAKIVIS